MKTIECSATPDGKICCELYSKKNSGSTVYVVHVFETDDYCHYRVTHQSYPTGNKRKAMITYKQYKNRYLRNKY